MSYRLNPGREMPGEIARVADEELEKAAALLADPAGEREEAIHDARKRLKKLRGLLQLVRVSDVSLYRRENGRFRDAAKRLSGARDRTALIEALTALHERFGIEAQTEPMERLGGVLEARRKAAVGDDAGLAETIAGVVRELESARGDWQGWQSARGRAAARAGLLDGLEHTYRRARQGARMAAAKGGVTRFHDLRKQVKYHAMHLKLLSAAWPEALGPVRKLADAVADDLGRDHDYAVMRAEMEADPHNFPVAADREAIARLIGAYQHELRAKSLAACARLFAEKPRAFRRRMEAYMEAAGRAEAAGAEP